MKVVSCAVDPELAETLAVAAAAKGWPRSRMVRSILEKWAFVRGLKVKEIPVEKPVPRERGFLERWFS